MTASEEYGSVRNWVGRLAPTTARINKFHLDKWLGWMTQNGGDFAEFNPDQMVEYQAEAQGRDAYKLLDNIQRYVTQMEGRRGYKAKAYSSLRSFFTHNRCMMPPDKQFMIRSEKPPVQGKLKPEVIRRVALSSKGAYRAIILSMLMGGMDLAGFEHWNQTGWPELKEALDRGDKVHTITLPGRKKFRNIKTYKTRIGRDALDAIREYAPSRPAEGTAIFYDQYGQPVSKNALQLYWRRRLVRLGYLKPKSGAGPSTRYGLNVHEIRDSFRTLWSMSGAAPHVAEAQMGHTAYDPLGYDKSAEDDMFATEQYLKAEPWLNLISDGTAFGRVDKSEVERLRRELAETKRGQGDEVLRLEARLEEAQRALGDREGRLLHVEQKLDILTRALTNPETAPALWKALEEVEEKAKTSA